MKNMACFLQVILNAICNAVHPIGSELAKPSDMISAVRISLVLCAIIYSSIGIFGYLLFGESVMSDILVNFDRSSGSAMGALLNDTVRLSYALHLMLAFPLLNFSLRTNIDELLFSRRPLLAKDTPRFLSITGILLAFSYFASIAFPNIWYFFQFMGSTAAVSIAFIFPGAITLRYSLKHAVLDKNRFFFFKKKLQIEFENQNKTQTSVSEARWLTH